jgi:DnaJ domain
MTERNHYDVLGLTPNADGTAVNRTYWQLARKYQADATSDPRAHHMLDELNEAYAVLGTPVLRTAYDAAHPATDDTLTPPQDGVRSGMRPERGGSSKQATHAGLPAWLTTALAPYAMIALGAVGLGAGTWSGNFLLAGLGTCAALGAGAALMRHKIAGLTRDAGGSPSEVPESVREPAPERSRALDIEPLSVSMVRRGGVPVDELRLSTASMVGRWRSAVGAAAGTASGETIDAERGPDSTLVDIFRSEHELESPSEPLSAVLDVLRGSRRPV